MNSLPYPGGTSNQMTAASGNAGWWAVITARDTTMEKIVRQNE